VFKVVEDAFSIQEVHGDAQEIPVQGFCEPQASSSTGDVDNTDNFFEGNDLNCSDDYDYVDMACEQGT
jgi:hypothetical protein